MTIWKKHRKHFICLAVLFLFCFQSVGAQPGCGSNFSSEEACAWPIPSSEYVFLGKVASVSVNKSEIYPREKKIVVEIEASLNGSLGRTINLTVTNDAGDCFGGLNVGTRRVFTASSTVDEKGSRLVSRHWSNPINDDYPKHELGALLAEIRAIVKKVKQPRLVGAVIEKGRYADGRWLRLASGAGGKLGYDKILEGGHANVVVTARRKDGLEFRTATGIGGYFVFKDLPNGLYEVTADLPVGYTIRADGTFHTYDRDKNYVLIDDSVCSKKVWFSVQLQGSVKVRIRGMRKSWSHATVHLYRVVSAAGGKRELVESRWDRPTVSSPAARPSEQVLEHAFKEVPVGEYVVMLSITTSPNKPSPCFFYPGTFEVDKATYITVEPGRTNSLDITIPESLPDENQ